MTTMTTTRRPRDNNRQLLRTYRPVPPEETLYSQERRHDPRDDETPVQATEATATTYPESVTDEHEHLA